MLTLPILFPLIAGQDCFNEWVLSESRRVVGRTKVFWCFQILFSFNNSRTGTGYWFKPGERLALQNYMDDCGRGATRGTMRTSAVCWLEKFFVLTKCCILLTNIVSFCIFGAFFGLLNRKPSLESHSAIIYFGKQKLPLTYSGCAPGLWWWLQWVLMELIFIFFLCHIYIYLTCVIIFVSIFCGEFIKLNLTILNCRKKLFWTILVICVPRSGRKSRSFQENI